jgi:hypothetical protein
VLIAALLAITPAAPVCDFARAEPTTVRKMAAVPEKWLGRCVRLEGFTIGNTFYQDVAATYRYDATDRESRPNGGWLGVYFRRSGLRFHRRPMRVAIAGVVHDCATDYEAAEATAGPGVLLMVVGYCHYRAGLVLHDAEVRRRGPALLVRQVGDAARRQFGDLFTVAEAGPPPAPAQALFARVEAALESGDEAAIQRLIEPYDAAEPAAAAARSRYRKLVKQAYSPFRRLLSERRSPVLFTTQQWKGEGDPDERHWFACWCTAASCDGRWPISASDTQAESVRPYACLRASRGSTETHDWELSIGTRPTGRAEPRTSRRANYRRAPQKA